ncbi:intercellular adhesin biosynthesis polysaccharide N-deacetylase [Staphylococcus epidermidis]|uniref:intercellular adhesin biosynthesis polysaccharide N-deacetylase n=2 Tax=Staphylococcus epidermidis TaxID=1282 RepID=UPI0011A7A6DE|nr:intercellular adhesin biosynthesis polysaccharide N-deacetylase [Staphylococcus epidermidis]
MRNCFNFFKILIIFIIMCSTLNNTMVWAKENKNKRTLNNNNDNGNALALNYHRVRDNSWIENILFSISNSKEAQDYSVTKDEFEKEIKWLKKNNARFLTERELQKYKSKGTFPKRSVWINFDDMDMSVYKNAHPILKKHNVPATGFIITNHVGDKDFHNLNMISEKNLKEMKNSNVWTFSSHTDDTHDLTKDNKPMMKKKNDRQLKKDISKSNKYIKKHFNKENNSIAYPYGEGDKRIIKVLKSGGIKYAYTLKDKAISYKDDNYNIPRILTNKDSFNKLIKKWDGFKDDKN